MLIQYSGSAAGGRVDTAASDISIDGKDFSDSYVADCPMLCDKSENAYVKINLAKKYKTLKARLGVNDQSEIGTDSITITLVGDDALLKTVTLHKGQHVDVSLNVTGVLELDFNFSGRLGKVEPAVGEPRVYR